MAAAAGDATSAVAAGDVKSATAGADAKAWGASDPGRAAPRRWRLAVEAPPKSCPRPTRRGGGRRRGVGPGRERGGRRNKCGQRGGFSHL
jgi:hypothetical protein